MHKAHAAPARSHPPACLPHLKTLLLLDSRPRSSKVTVRKAHGDVYAATIDDKVAMKIGGGDWSPNSSGTKLVRARLHSFRMCACACVRGCACMHVAVWGHGTLRLGGWEGGSALGDGGTRIVRAGGWVVGAVWAGS